MKNPTRCAIYTRKSTEEGLEQEFNSLDAQREAGEAFVASQKSEGWVCLPRKYDDGGFTGGNMDRPALRQLMTDIAAGEVDCVVVYKVDRLSRSLMDFARMMEAFEKHQISFVSVTQQFNTTHSMGRLTLNILLSFAQFEREIISERTRDKIAATRRKGKWTGGWPILGYDVDPKTFRLVVNEPEAERVRAIYSLYLGNQSLLATAAELNRRGWTTKRWKTRKGPSSGGREFDKATLRQLLTNVAYAGNVKYKTEVHPGEHEGIVAVDVWQDAQRLLSEKRRERKIPISRRSKYGALLIGLIRCTPCDCGMVHTYTARANRRYRYYVCAKAQRQGWNSCPSKSVPAQEIEQFVVEQIRAIGRDPKLRAATLAQVRQQEAQQRRADAGELARVDGELKRLRSESRGENGGGGHQQRIDELLARRVQLRARPGPSPADAIGDNEFAAALKAFDPIWEHLTPHEQADAVRLLVQQVGYDGAASAITIAFHPHHIRHLGRKPTPVETPT